MNNVRMLTSDELKSCLLSREIGPLGGYDPDAVQRLFARVNGLEILTFDEMNSHVDALTDYTSPLSSMRRIIDLAADFTEQQGESRLAYNDSVKLARRGHVILAIERACESLKASVGVEHTAYTLARSRADELKAQILSGKFRKG